MITRCFLIPTGSEDSKVENENAVINAWRNTLESAKLSFDVMPREDLTQTIPDEYAMCFTNEAEAMTFYRERRGCIVLAQPNPRNFYQEVRVMTNEGPVSRKLTDL